MKLKIVKESESMYFIKILGKKGLYAQGESLENAVENLISVYQMAKEIEEEKNKEKLIQPNGLLKKTFLSGLHKLDFSSVVINL